MEWDDLDGCVGWYSGSAWICTNSVFAPRHTYLGEEDEQIELLYKARSIVGTIIVTYAAIHYHHINGIPEAFGEIEASVNWTVLFCLFALAPAGLAIALITKPESRRDAVAQLRYPALAGGAYLGIFLVVMPVLVKLVPAFGDNFLTAIVGGVVSIAFFFWVLIFLCRTIYLLATGLFRLGDGHPLLPPVVGTIAAWVLAVKSLVTNGISGGEPAVVTLALLLGGPASITILAVAEFLRLRGEYPDDFPFRAGPLRVPRE
jgi:hypothetical protein